MNGVEVVGMSNFKFDDNDDNQVDTGETDTEDSSHGSTGRSISNTSNCIDDNATFTLKVKVTTTQSTNFQWQATRRGAAVGQGGSLVGTFAVVSSSTPQTETVLNAFHVKSIEILGKNGAAGPITSVSFVPPSGVAIAEVTSGTNPGTWDAGARRFTFATPVAPNATFHVEVTFENLAAGDTTELSWNANYRLTNGSPFRRHRGLRGEVAPRANAGGAADGRSSGGGEARPRPPLVRSSAAGSTRANAVVDLTVRRPRVL